MFKNEAGVWTALSDDSSSVDVSAKVVIATTTHFSKWGVFGGLREGSATVGTSAASSFTGNGLKVLAAFLAMYSYTVCEYC